jgi:hypothetical protein
LGFQAKRDLHAVYSLGFSRQAIYGLGIRAKRSLNIVYNLGLGQSAVSMQPAVSDPKQSAISMTSVTLILGKARSS